MPVNLFEVQDCFNLPAVPVSFHPEIEK